MVLETLVVLMLYLTICSLRRPLLIFDKNFMKIHNHLLFLRLFDFKVLENSYCVLLDNVVSTHCHFLWISISLNDFITSYNLLLIFHTFLFIVFKIFRFCKWCFIKKNEKDLKILKTFNCSHNNIKVGMAMLKLTFKA